jgi:hypothetical protein
MGFLANFNLDDREVDEPHPRPLALGELTLTLFNGFANDCDLFGGLRNGNTANNNADDGGQRNRYLTKGSEYDSNRKLG